MQFWALIVDSFRESRDRKIFWVMLVISLAVAAAMFCIAFEPGKITVLFGMWEMETDQFTVAGKLREDLIAGIAVEWIMDVILGSVGIILAIIATAGFFPALMERGAIEVVLSKPMPRWKLFLGKYLGGLTFVLFHATIFIVLTFLVVGFRWGTWLPGYLLSIPLVLLLFSYLYCVSVLVAVVSRSTVAAVLLTLGAWISFTGVQSINDVFIMFPEWQKHETYYRASGVARWIVPNTQDVLYNAKKWSRAASAFDMMPEPDEEDREMVGYAKEIEEARMAIPAVYTIGSSLLFEAAVVLLAMWKFTRRDY